MDIDWEDLVGTVWVLVGAWDWAVWWAHYDSQGSEAYDWADSGQESLILIRNILLLFVVEFVVNRDGPNWPY